MAFAGVGVVDLAILALRNHVQESLAFELLKTTETGFRQGSTREGFFVLSAAKEGEIKVGDPA